MEKTTKTEEWLASNAKFATDFSPQAYTQQLNQSLTPLWNTIQQAPPQIQHAMTSLYGKFYQGLMATLKNQKAPELNAPEQEYSQNPSMGGSSAADAAREIAGHLGDKGNS